MGCTTDERNDDDIREMLGYERVHDCDENFIDNYPSEELWWLKGKNGKIALTEDELYALGYVIVDVFGGIIHYYEMGDEKNVLNEIYSRVFNGVFTTSDEAKMLTDLCNQSDKPIKKLHEYAWELMDNLTDEEKEKYLELLHG